MNLVQKTILCLLSLLALLLVSACGAKSSRTRCDSDEDCKSGRACIDNYCKIINQNNDQDSNIADVDVEETEDPQTKETEDPQTEETQTEETQTEDILDTQENDTPDETVCTPDCYGRQCGLDPVCGESCGPDCPEGEYCHDGDCRVGSCVPDCEDSECGPDPVCGESCGTCEYGINCSNGLCMDEECLGICGVVECGLVDRCNEDCGPCQEGFYCDNNTCVEEECISDCSESECGPDPLCGESCGRCIPGSYCDNGECIEEECVPDCSHIECGPDPLCEESCGSCANGFYCNDGDCIEEQCIPNCSGRHCGPDPICGESCGNCNNGFYCDDGNCIEEQCEPECSGLECGPDPDCGLSCGNCPLGENCSNGNCIGSECSPPCSGDTSFCNEINECVISECASENCTQYDPNLHCDGREEGPACVCNPGWVLNEGRTGCVECLDDDTGNDLETPTTVEIPLDHTGILCAWDVFSFDLEAGLTTIIDLDGFEPGVNDLDLYLLLDNVENSTVKSSTSGDSTERIVYTAPETQTYYLIVLPYSGPMPVEYHLSVRDTCESDEDCGGGFFTECNNNSRCETTCEDDGVASYLEDLEEAELPIEDMPLTLCLDTADVFLLTLDELDFIYVYLDFIHNNGNLDVYFFDEVPESEIQPVVGSDSTDNDESFSYIALEAGEYYLVVLGDQNSYTLNVRNTCETDEECGYPLECVNGECVATCQTDEDCFEAFGAFATCNGANQRCEGGSCEDDGIGSTSAEATTIELPVNEENYSLCTSEEDWFIFSAEEGDNISVNIEFIHDNLDIDTQIFFGEPDDNSDSIAQSQTTTNEEEMNITVAETGDYYLHIYGYNVGESWYILSISN